MSTSQYQELRVMIDDLVDAWPNVIDHHAIREARMYVRTHCRACGARLSMDDIEQRRLYCRACRDNTEYDQICAVREHA